MNDSTTNRSTYVAAAPELPALYAPRTPQSAPLPEIDLRSVLSTSQAQAQHNDAMQAARAFLLRYSALSCILLVLSIALTFRLQLHLASGALLFAVACIGAYYALSELDWRHSGPGAERLRLELAADVLSEYIDAHRDVQLAQLRMQAQHLQARERYNRQQVDAYKAAAATVGPASAPEAPAKDNPLLSAVLALYDPAAALVDSQGRIDRAYIIPWGRRGGLSQSERNAVQAQLQRIAQDAPGGWLLRFNKLSRLWELNTKAYRTGADAINAIDLHGRT
jgi:hypothetical protein